MRISRTVSSDVVDMSSIDLDNISSAFQNSIFTNKIKKQKKKKSRFSTIREAEAEHGMPWKESIDPEQGEDGLLFMEFWKWQMGYMEDNLTNLRVESTCGGDGESDTDFSFNVNKKKKARIVNICASSDEYKKIRMTYYDAGETTQVFNTVWYPDPEYNLPVLGVDLLAFNRKKYLSIVDFQPIHDDEKDHATPYEHLLKPIKDGYDSLKGRMSAKFYDETQHFSEQMLFARFDDESIIDRDLLPAYQRYVQTHLDVIRDTDPNPEQVPMVLDKVKDYDTYSAERDPATGLFAAMYGKEWAEEFVHEFLFSTSDRQKPDEEKDSSSPSTASSGPFMGGGGGGPPPRRRPPSQQRR